ncbi:MAG: hypothetical protein M3444_18140, partial [Acidobacteriota bacterium]|nr:hypothetical protein [Acidobacteriota bacterium]
MHTVERPMTKRSGLSIYLAAASLLLGVLLLPAAARAQWTTAGNTTSTTNNVGVGTTNPVTPVEARGTGSFGGDVVTGAGGLASPFGGVGRVQNLLANSETVGGAGWSLQNSASASQNFTAAPDGNMTAAKLVCGSTNSSAAYVTVGAASGGAYTFSFWAKASPNSSKIQYGIYDANTFSWVTFVTVSDLDQTNWRRLVATGTPTSGHNVQVYIYPDTAGGVVGNYNYVWGAQMTGTNSPGVYARTAGSQVAAFNGGVIYGNFGIGTATPTHSLEVNGTINASQGITGQTITAVYQDVAEWVPSSQKLTAGTVVVLDTNKTNHVLASTKAYDTGVAGVVSDTPGVILGQGGADKVKVATTGRVRVRADATRASIRVGDLLV